jgi:hypothetical protein
MNKPRLLKPDEISCRVQQVTDSNGAIILLYKDARVDMNLLDETYGEMNWQREHTSIDGNLFCTIKVWDKDKNQWVSKQDVGVESNTEATKGEASDAFKRAGFNWGIGRELYTGPFIFIQLEEGEWMINTKSGKHQATFRFGLSVKEIKCNESREIIRLVLVDKKGKERFTFAQGKPMKEAEIPPEKVKEPAKVTMTVSAEELKQRLKEVRDIQIKHNVSADALKAITKEMGCRKLDEQTAGEYEDFLVAFKNAVS